MSEHSYIHGTSPSEQERLAGLNRHSNPSFIQFLPANPGDRVLEVGSGLGILATQAAVERGISITGVEYNPDQLAEARALDSPVTWMQGDAHHLPFSENSFDGVYCRYVLEHVQNPAQVLDEIYRALKPGGWYVGQENNIGVHETWPDCPNFELVWAKFAELQADLGGDAFIGKKLHSLALQAGFTDIEVSIEPEIYAHGQERYSSWLINMIGVAESGREALISGGYCSSSEFQAAVDELRSLLDNRSGSVYFYWNRIKARKPLNP